MTKEQILINDIERFFNGVETLLSLATLTQLKTSKRKRTVDSWIIENGLYRPPLNIGNDVISNLIVIDKQSQNTIFNLQFWLWDYEVNKNYYVKNELSIYDNLFSYEREPFSNWDNDCKNIALFQYKHCQTFKYCERLKTYLKNIIESQLV